MQLVFDSIQPVRARRTDPSTSHAAARNAVRFAESHKDRILAALCDGPATAHQISERTGLTVVQIDRRLPELQRDGLAAPMLDGCMCEVVFNGARVWEVA